MSSIKYGSFYRKYGIRKTAQILSPEFTSVTELELPKGSIYHHIPSDIGDIGPTYNDLLIANHESYMSIDHIYDLSVTIGGNPVPDPTNTPSQHSKDYKSKFRKIKLSKDMERSLKDERALGIFNYSPLVSTYKYRESAYKDFYMWWNAVNSALDHISKEVLNYDRQHFIEISLPKIIPSVKLMVKYNGLGADSPKKLLKVFSDPKMLLLAEIFKFLGARRHESRFGKMAILSLKKLNIIFRDDFNWIVLNLGDYLEMHKAIIETDDQSKDDNSNLTLDEGKRVEQLLFFKLIQALAGTRSNVMSDIDVVLDDDSITAEEKEVKLTNIEEGIVDVENLDKDIDDYEELLVKKMVNDDDEIDLKLDITTDEMIDERLLELMDQGIVSKAVRERVKNARADFLNSRAPNGQKYTDYVVIPPEIVNIDKEDVKIKANIKTVTDSSLLETRRASLRRRYIKDGLPRHIVSSIMRPLESNDLVICKIDQDKVLDAHNDYTTYSVQTMSFNGTKSTFKLHVPNVSENGTYTYNGVDYYFKDQAVDLPIRKTGPAAAALTSYTAKLFVIRSDKSVSSSDKWLKKTISNSLMDDGGKVKNIVFGDSSYADLKLPRIYSSLSRNYKKLLLADDIEILLDLKVAEKLVTESELKKIKSKGMYVIGTRKKNPILMDDMGAVYDFTNGEIKTTSDSFASIIGINLSAMPLDVCELNIYKKNIPLVFILLYKLGIDKLFKITLAKRRVVPAGSQLKLDDNEYAIKFKDVTIVLNRTDYKSQLIFAGLNRYHRTIKNYNYNDLNRNDVIMNIFEANGIRIGLQREIGNQYKNFVDPIMEEILIKLKEPTTLIELYIKAVELLTDDRYINETDPDGMRTRGVERLAGFINEQITKAIRLQSSRSITEKSNFSINPNAIWQALNEDSSIAVTESTNALESIKESESVTYLGSGGRSKVSIVKSNRRYFDSDLGLTGESSVDSSSVGINWYTTHNPDIVDIYGLREKQSLEDMQAGHMLSTTGVFFPGTDMDELKRTVFASIQGKHTIAIKGGITPPLRTGAETTMAHRVDPLWATAARDNLVVTEVTKKYISVKDKDGYITSHELGRVFGKIPGHKLPFTIATEHTVGSKIKPGDIITYNAEHFKPSLLNVGQVESKMYTLAMVVLIELSETDEDASVIGSGLPDRLVTRLSDTRDIIVKYRDFVDHVVKVGQHVDSDDHLMTIQDDTIASLNQDGKLSESSVNTLTLISQNAPKANHSGVVEKIEVFYNGDKEDMTPTLRALADQSDKELGSLTKKTKGVALTGVTDSTVKVGRDILDFQKALIRITITEELSSGYGDKLVYGNQMKSVVSGTLVGVNKTYKTQEDIDAYFSYASELARNLTSPDVQMAITTLMVKFGDDFVKDFYN